MHSIHHIKVYLPPPLHLAAPPHYHHAVLTTQQCRCTLHCTCWCYKCYCLCFWLARCVRILTFFSMTKWLAIFSNMYFVNDGCWANFSVLFRVHQICLCKIQFIITVFLFLANFAHSLFQLIIISFLLHRWVILW